jgi:hypothetical protein
MHAAFIFRLVGKEQVVWKKWLHLTWTGSSERPWRLSSISAMWTLWWPCLDQVLDTSYPLPEGTEGIVCAGTYGLGQHTVCPASSLHLVNLPFLVSHINFSHLFVFSVFPILFTHYCLLHTTHLNLWLWLLHTTTTALLVLCQSPGVCCPSMKPSFHTHKIFFWLFLKMKVAGSPHTLVTNFPSTQHHISQDVNCHHFIHTKLSFDSSWRWREQVPPKHW